MFDAEVHVEDFPPFLLRYVGYSLKQWLVTLYQDGPPQLGHRSVLECLFNKKLSRGRSVVKNAFGILKQSFRELLGTIDLHVTFIPDVVVCWCLLHNMVLGQEP